MKEKIIYHKRKAIAMIELIFAIVVIGIVLLSVPNLLSMSAQSGYTALQQEAIATASSQINMLFTKHWDDNNTEGNVIILQVSNGHNSLNARNGRVLRLNIASGLPLSATAIGQEVGDALDDIDDYNGATSLLRDYRNTSTSEGDNIDTDITIATNINYISDAADNDYNTSQTIQYDLNTTGVGPTTNIKAINITLTTTNIATELDKLITLNAFTCNIGGYTPDSRDYP